MIQTIKQAQQTKMAISTELLNGILEMVYIASLDGNTTTVTDAKDRTESSGGKGGCIINAKERCERIHAVVLVTAKMHSPELHRNRMPIYAFCIINQHNNK